MIVHSRLESANLAGNLLGDPSERDLFVYLPPGYEDSDRRYPTAYLLQAYGETAATMVSPATDGEGWRPPIEDVRTADLRNISVPTLVIGARHDTMDPRHMEMMSTKVQRGTFLYCPDGSHLAMYHDQVTYFDGIIDFIRQVEPRVQG